jgi:hypothetical protein
MKLKIDFSQIIIILINLVEKTTKISVQLSFHNEKIGKIFKLNFFTLLNPSEV